MKEIIIYDSRWDEQLENEAKRLIEINKWKGSIEDAARFIKEEDWFNCKQVLNFDVEADIIVLANLGLWNGRHTGYKIIKSHNVGDCIVGEYDNIIVYIDKRKDLAINGYHHDGANYMIARTIKKGVTERQLNNFLDKIIYGEVKREDITRYTDGIGERVMRRLRQY